MVLSHPVHSTWVHQVLYHRIHNSEPRPPSHLTKPTIKSQLRISLLLSEPLHYAESSPPILCVQRNNYLALIEPQDPPRFSYDNKYRSELLWKMALTILEHTIWYLQVNRILIHPLNSHHHFLHAIWQLTWCICKLECMCAVRLDSPNGDGWQAEGYVPLFGVLWDSFEDLTEKRKHRI